MLPVCILLPVRLSSPGHLWGTVAVSALFPVERNQGGSCLQDPLLCIPPVASSGEKEKGRRESGLPLHDSLPSILSMLGRTLLLALP